MSELSTQSDFRSVQKLPFCYLCGEAFTEETKEARDMDHVPPKSIFALSDRNYPLQLPTHSACNRGQSNHDEVVGQLIATIHGKYPEPANTKLDINVAEDVTTGAPSAWLNGTNLHKIVRRWLRAFHAALYQEFLPDNDGTENGTRFIFDPPLPVIYVDENNRTRINVIRPHHAQLVKQIKQNRLAKTLDRITCCNGKCVYECVWDKTDAGQSVCIFALKVYDWGALANTKDFPKRGCVGVYFPANGRPTDSTTASRLFIPVSNTERLDPFGQ